MFHLMCTQRPVVNMIVGFVQCEYPSIILPHESMHFIVQYFSIYVDIANMGATKEHLEHVFLLFIENHDLTFSL